MNPRARWKVITVCRKSDPDRSLRFFRALKQLNATGKMGDLDDGPEQTPLAGDQVQNTILELLAADRPAPSISPGHALSEAAGFDLIITHGPRGEYTRHRRHEEAAKAVLTLWQKGCLPAKHLWQFAYEDGGGKHLPQPVQSADLKINLPENIWQKKYYIITNVYGFTADSFEARTAVREEAFWCLSAVGDPRHQSE